MRVTRFSQFRSALLALPWAWLIACAPDNTPQTGSQTNWLRACDDDADCNGLACRCGVCTRECAADSTCGELPGSACITAQEPGAIALCNGSTPTVTGLCIPRCETAGCGAGQTCVSGICNPIANPGSHVTVLPKTRLQTLTGFGATLAYAETAVVNHPKRAELYNAMFSTLGLDVLRLRNRYGYSEDADLTTAAAIVQAATSSLGRRPTVLLASWSPPTSLKASRSLVCRGNGDTCTLSRSASGGFDYAAYGAYWRSSLDAYANAGLLADYIAIQNNPDFVPTSAVPGEGCRMLPTEGTASVSVDGVETTVALPGFAEAQTAVMDQMAGFTPAPRFIAPEVADLNSVAKYLQYLDASKVDAIGHHLYGSDPMAVDLSTLTQLEQLGRNYGRPLFQTEMSSDGIATAILMHYAVTVEGASAYLHNAIVGPPPDATNASNALIGVSASDFTLASGYYALRHFAQFTDPGWIRVDTSIDATAASTVQPSRPLASAWLSPDGLALTIVLVNSGAESIDTQVDVGFEKLQSSRVFRTAFDGEERFAELGALSEDGTVHLPGHSVVTVTVQSK
ncbi:MAG TPA: hypothetical protein VIV60_30775 [Polyangiaceae bacterium]